MANLSYNSNASFLSFPEFKRIQEYSRDPERSERFRALRKIVTLDHPGIRCGIRGIVASLEGNRRPIIGTDELGDALRRMILYSLTNGAGLLEIMHDDNALRP